MIYIYTWVFIFLLSAVVVNGQSITLQYKGITDNLGSAPFSKDEVPILAVTGGFATAMPGGTNFQFTNYTVTKAFDPSSINMMRDLANGTRGDIAIFRFYGPANEVLKTITLEDVYIVSYQMGASECDDCPNVTESVNIDFGKVKVEEHVKNLVFTISKNTTNN